MYSLEESSIYGLLLNKNKDYIFEVTYNFK